MSFNNAIRRVFGFKKYESVRELLFYIGMLPLDLKIDVSKLKFVQNLGGSRELVHCFYSMWINGSECYDCVGKYDLQGFDGVSSKVWEYFGSSLRPNINM